MNPRTLRMIRKTAPRLLALAVVLLAGPVTASVLWDVDRSLSLWSLGCWGLAGVIVGNLGD